MKSTSGRRLLAAPLQPHGGETCQARGSHGPYLPRASSRQVGPWEDGTLQQVAGAALVSPGPTAWVGWTRKSLNVTCKVGTAPL